MAAVDRVPKKLWPGLVDNSLTAKPIALLDHGLAPTSIDWDNIKQVHALMRGTTRIKMRIAHPVPEMGVFTVQFTLYDHNNAHRQLDKLVKDIACHADAWTWDIAKNADFDVQIRDMYSIVNSMPVDPEIGSEHESE